MSSMKQAQVIYYLCRGGTMEHPHLIDVAYSECHGLLLKDVKRRLVAIRGRTMPDLFSWSYKSNYKKDFIWHDVSDNDVILSTNDTEYILKGSEIVDGESNLEQSSNDSESEIQYKNMLKDHACLTRSAKASNSAKETIQANQAASKKECIIQAANDPLEDSGARNISEVVKIYKRKPASGSGNDATTQTEDDEASLQAQEDSDKQQQHRTSFQQCRGEKPLPNPPFVHKKKISATSSEMISERKAVAAVSGIDPSITISAKDDSVQGAAARMKKAGGSSLVFKQMFPCASIGTKAQQNVSGLSGPLSSSDFLGQKQHLSAKEVGTVISSWKQSSTIWRKGGKLLSSPYYDGGSRHELIHGIPGGTPNGRFQDFQGYRQSTLSRYRPRHSFSNSDYFDGCDVYLRPEKVKEVDHDLAWPRHSSARLSTESLYEVDCKSRTYDFVDDEPTLCKGAESPRASVSSHIINKLVLEAKANESVADKDKVVWWEELRTPKRENKVNEGRIRKSKLDWEKNLQEAVNMIIRPVEQRKQQLLRQ